MNPKIFLRIGGSFLITIGILGLLGFFQQISNLGFFHPPYWINYFHLIFGSLVLYISLTKHKKVQTIFTLLAAVTGISIGTLGLLLGSYIAENYNIPELKDRSDHIAHLIVGLTALWAFKNKG